MVDDELRDAERYRRMNPSEQEAHARELQIRRRAGLEHPYIILECEVIAARVERCSAVGPSGRIMDFGTTMGIDVRDVRAITPHDASKLHNIIYREPCPINVGDTIRVYIDARAPFEKGYAFSPKPVKMGDQRDPCWRQLSRGLSQQATDRARSPKREVHEQEVVDSIEVLVKGVVTARYPATAEREHHPEPLYSTEIG